MQFESNFDLEIPPFCATSSDTLNNINFCFYKFLYPIIAIQKAYHNDKEYCLKQYILQNPRLEVDGVVVDLRTDAYRKYCNGVVVERTDAKKILHSQWSNESQK